MGVGVGVGVGVGASLELGACSFARYGNIESVPSNKDLK